LNVIPGGAIVATSGNLSSVTITGGTANAANVTFSSVTGAQCSYIGMYKDTGTSSTSPLILLLDTATNLPVTPNGGDITVQWDTGTNKIFTLFEGLDEAAQRLTAADRRNFGRKVLDWLRGMKIPAELGPGGIWIPTPKVVLA
jgi:hypothetical protein